MGSLQIFQYIFDQLETPLVQSIADLVAALIAYAAAPLQTALVLYIALTGVLLMRGQTSEPVGGLIGRALKLTLIAWFATNGSVYVSWVQDFFLTVLPNDVTQAVTASATGGVSITANSFDAIWKQAYEAGLRVWEMLDYWDVGEEIVIVVFWAASLIACVAGFTIWFLSHVILGLFIVVGPLLIGLALFSATKPIFERWIGAMISCVILQVVVVVLVTLTTSVEGRIVQQIASYTGPNQFEQLYTLFAGVIFFLFATVIIFQLPSFATSLAGGLHFHTGAVARTITSGTRRFGRGGTQVGQALGSGAGSGLRSARQRIRPQTGGSLSNGAPR